MQPLALRQALSVALLCAALAHAQAAPPAEAHPTPRVWDVPEVIEVVDVPGRTVAGGIPVAMHAVRSRQGSQALERALYEQFKQAGLFLSPQVERLTRHRQVTGLDVDTLITYTVFLQDNADHTTTVILTEAFGAEMRAPGPAAFIAAMPASRGLVHSSGEGLQTLSYRVKATPEEVRSYHLEVLGKAGYKESSPLVFDRKGEGLRVRVHQEPGGEVLVTVLHAAADQQQAAPR